MRLVAPCNGIDFDAKDIYGEPINLSQLQGKKVMLSFFRDAACPFCNLRIYELTNQYKMWKDKNLEIIAVFSSSSEEVKRFVAKHPRPFRMVSDPDLAIYTKYGVEHSSMALVKALLFKLPRIIKGMFKGGRPRNNPNVKLVPADFLFDTDGQVKHTWYGRDTSDHMPMEQVNRFINAA